MVRALPSRDATRRSTQLALLGLTLLLAACRTLTPTAVATAEQRRTELRAILNYQFSGRVASVAGDQAFSAALDWQQRASDSALQIRAPFGLASLNVDYQDGRLLLRTSDGTQFGGDSAQEQLRAWLGFTPPLASFRYWLLGCSDPGSAAEEHYDDQQRLTQLKQDGWLVDYQSYRHITRQWLPERLSIERDGRKLKLVISRWQTS